MVSFAALAALAGVPPLVAAGGPYPVAQSSVPSSDVGKWASAFQSYVTPMETEPAYLSLSEYMATATGLPPDVQAAFSSARPKGPVNLGGMLFDATTTGTPSWLGEIPTALAQYAVSVADADASIKAEALGITASPTAAATSSQGAADGSAVVHGVSRFNITGAVLGCVLVMMAWL